MAHNSLVFFVESLHRRPSEREAFLQFAGMGGQAGVLPRPSRRGVLARPDGVPVCEPKVWVLGGMVGAFQDVLRDVSLREVGYRIAARFEEQEYVLAIGDPGSAEAHA
jgi:hypothetical protein